MRKQGKIPEDVLSKFNEARGFLLSLNLGPGWENVLSKQPDLFPDQWTIDTFGLGTDDFYFNDPSAMAIRAIITSLPPEVHKRGKPTIHVAVEMQVGANRSSDALVARLVEVITDKYGKPHHKEYKDHPYVRDLYTWSLLGRSWI